MSNKSSLEQLFGNIVQATRVQEEWLGIQDARIGRLEKENSELRQKLAEESEKNAKALARNV
jgi:hypothetical protein